MLTIFGGESGRQGKRAIIEKMNDELNKTLDKIFKECYPDIHQQFIDAGFTEEEAQSNIEEMKSEMQRDMIVHAQQSFKEKLSKNSARTILNPLSSDQN